MTKPKTPREPQDERDQHRAMHPWIDDVDAS